MDSLKPTIILTVLYLLVLCISSQEDSPSHQADAASQERSIEQIELCGYIGGTCWTACDRELRHKWDIALCPNAAAPRCCAIEPPISSTGNPSSCETGGGTCSAWYSPCSHGSQQAEDGDGECPLAWQKCCVPILQTIAQIPNSSSGTGTTQPAHSAESSENLSQSNYNDDDSLDSDAEPDQCGQQLRAPRQKRIIGGSLSPAGTWPWHVGISSAIGYIHCAGTIINKKWILTAAHCFKRVTDQSYYRVVTGVPPEHTGTYYSIKRIVKHNLYEEHAHVGVVGHTHKYDIALVELHDNITYNDVVQPVCLPATTSSFESQTCWLTGWGSTRFNSTEEDFRLRHVRGQVLSRSQCESHWGSLVDTKMICFGNERQGGCRGDSGGGLFCQNSDGFYTIAGVISWGSAQCNQGATVLTDIAQYSTWIQNVIASTGPP